MDRNVVQVTVTLTLRHEDGPQAQAADVAESVARDLMIPGWGLFPSLVGSKVADYRLESVKVDKTSYGERNPAAGN